MKKVLFILLLLPIIVAKGQYLPSFSQYIYNGLAINPAYAGSKEAFTASVFYRNQWMGFDGAPTDQTFSIHSPLKDPSLALGLMVFHEKIGIRNYSSVFLNYAFRIRVWKGKLSLGLKAGFTSGKQDRIDLTENDVVFNDNTLKYFLPNFGLGVYYYDDAYFAGVSVPLIFSYKNDPVNGKYQIYNDLNNYNFYFTTGIKLLRDREISWQPSCLVKYSTSSVLQFDLNLNATYRQFLTGGISYRNQNAIVFLFNVKVNPQLTVGGAYDFDMGELSKYNNGSMEFFIQYRFGYKVNVPDLRNF